MAGITYELLDAATGAHKAWLSTDGTATGAPFFVGPEPIFTGQLNTGAGQLQLQMDRWPGSTTMVFGDLVRITLPDGTNMGRWKYEGLSGDEEQSTKWLVNLMPLCAELKEVDYAANYTAVDQADQPHSGVTHFDTPVVAAVPLTKHCTVTAHANDGSTYALWFALQNGKVADTLSRAVGLGGPDWWWYADAEGHVELRHNGRRTVNIDNTDDAHPRIVWQQHAAGIDRLLNVQPMQGGPDQFGVPITATRTVTAGSYGTTTLGRRVGQPVIDVTLGDLATVEHMGDQILALSQTVIDSRTLHLVNTELLTPGDWVTITDAGGTSGAFYVTGWKLFGSTGVQEVTIATQYGDFSQRAGAAGAAAMSAVQSGVITGGGGGGICGGYQVLARAIPSSLTDTFAGGSGILVAVQFVLDSGGSCQIECKLFGSIRITPGSPASPFAVFLMCDESADLTGGAASGVSVHVEADGKYHPLSFFIPSGKALADGTYSAYLAVTGAAATIDLDYDLQVWLYSGGRTL